MKYARLLFIPFLSLLIGCAGTKAAYQAAESPDEYAFVLTEHYAALLREAVVLQGRSTTPVAVIESIKRVDLKAQPVIDRLRTVATAYSSVKSAATEAELQKAINDAVLVIAELVRVIKPARANPQGALSPVADFDPLRRRCAMRV